MMENLNITKSDISCSHLCDIPENADIKMFDEQVTMLCGTGCPADAEGEAINEDGANACNYNSCVTWDLNSGWRAGWGVWKGEWEWSGGMGRTGASAHLCRPVVVLLFLCHVSPQLTHFSPLSPSFSHRGLRCFILPAVLLN